ncbi:MAG TPA: ROK family protein [Limnochordales bacterium]
MGVVRSAVGIDIGGTKIAAGLVTERGELLWAQQEPTPASQGPTAIGQAVVRMASRAIERARALGLEPEGVGIGTGGQVDVVRQRVVASTRLLPGWQSMPLRDRVEEALGVPVSLDNDAKVVARAELLWGNARGCRHVLFVTLGTGVGGAVAVGGRVVDGARGFAGHLGHVTVRPGGAPCSCGRRGCLEAYASATGILRMARELAGESGVEDATDVFGLAAGGVPWAQDVLHEAADALGQALAGVIHVLDPERVVVGGGLSAWGEPWRARIESAIRRHLMDVFVSSLEVRLALLGPQAGVLGAAALALERRSDDSAVAVEPGPSTGRA